MSLKKQKPPIESSLFWFRRDLRSTDNTGLYLALTSGHPVHCVFVFDTEILDALPSKQDRRVQFIRESLIELKGALRKMGGDLIVRHGRADQIIPALAATLKATRVFANEDYEPAAVARDARVEQSLSELGATFRTCKDTVIFDKLELQKGAGGPFTVFTYFRRTWMNVVSETHLQAWPISRYASSLATPLPDADEDVPSLESMGFEQTNLRQLGIEPGERGAKKLLADFLDRIDDYNVTRNYPAVRGVSYLSVHNRFGTISIRQLASAAYAETLRRKNLGAEAWLTELVWREFYFHVLYNFPRVVDSTFHPAFNAIQWENDEGKFAAWCEARTGFPIIDAAMRQLNQTGYMHNRLRMVVGSFLTKDLLIDYRWGESYFAEKLNDFDMAANNGGWQWAASTGCDPQPYFRVFNPVKQSLQYDPDARFIRRYVPELAAVPDKYIHSPWLMPPQEELACGVKIGRDYPAPLVDHALQRLKAMAIYRAARGGGADPEAEKAEREEKPDEENAGELRDEDENAFTS
ncbi:MAG: deoxyribodipyrimidine photo-lyase [Betaproteobacteria bacterium]